MLRIISKKSCNSKHWT